ncbi:MAG: signal recognition particle-docking protein FtsY [Verrucomicrobia bacterium]|nr:signal recognition particle-docking protein FtsY [Verrucomicrobiota bacterium]
MLKFLKSSYKKVATALSKTRLALSDGIARLLARGIDEEALEELEELFYNADLGVETAAELTDAVRHLMRRKEADVIGAIEQKLLELLKKQDNRLIQAEKGPTVTLIIGVNGNGKTTSIAKLAELFRKNGETVLLGAADTFRAAAIDQLELWASRTGAQIVKGHPGADPAAVAFDALSAAVARNVTRVLIDTAGRLHTKTSLMEELFKIRKACEKVIPGSPHETLLVLDATTGQNAIEQAKTFHKFAPITGVILTKLDGTARGGIVIPIQKKLGVPVKFIGTGEGVDDLQPFHPEEFVKALLHSRE